MCFLIGTAFHDVVFVKMQHLLEIVHHCNCFVASVTLLESCVYHSVAFIRGCMVYHFNVYVYMSHP